MTAAPLPQTLDQARAEILRLRAHVEAQAHRIWTDGNIIRDQQRALNLALLRKHPASATLPQHAPYTTKPANQEASE